MFILRQDWDNNAYEYMSGMTMRINTIFDND